MSMVYSCVSILLLQNDETITQLEKDIKAAQEAALEAADSESITTSMNPDEYSFPGTVALETLLFCCKAEVEAKLLAFLFLLFFF